MEFVGIVVVIEGQPDHNVQEAMQCPIKRMAKQMNAAASQGTQPYPDDVALIKFRHEVFLVLS